MRLLCGLSTTTFGILSGLLIGWLVFASPPPPETPVPATKGSPCTTDEALRRENEHLKATLKALETQLKATPPATVQASPEDTSIEAYAVRVDALQETDPEFYATIKEAQAREQERIHKSRSERDTFLEDIDLSLMTEGQRVTHQAYCDALARMDALQDEQQQALEAGDDETFEAKAREAFELRLQLSDLRAAEYNALIGAIGQSMGLSKLDTLELTQLLHQIDHYLGRTTENVSIQILHEE